MTSDIDLLLSDFGQKLNIQDIKHINNDYNSPLDNKIFIGIMDFFEITIDDNNKKIGSCLNFSLFMIMNEVPLCHIIINDKSINNDHLVYKLIINETFNYYINIMNRILIWIDIDYSRPACDIYKFYYCHFKDDIKLLKKQFEKYFKNMNLEFENSMSRLLECLLTDQNPKKLLNEILSLAKLIKVDKQKQEFIANTTKSKQCSEIWLIHKKLRLTSSKFGEILKTTKDFENYAKNLIYGNSNTNRSSSLINHRYDQNSTLRSSINSQQTFQDKAMKYGKENEDKAIKAYENYILKTKKVNSTGFIIDINDPWLGVLPDGIVDDKVLIEIKCPYKGKELDTIDDLIKYRFNFYLDEHGKLKKNHIYYYQIQGIMHITKIKLCHFIVYTPKFLYMTKIAYDERWFNEVKKSLSRFYHTYYIIELLRSEMINHQKLLEDTIIYQDQLNKRYLLRNSIDHEVFYGIKPMNDKLNSINENIRLELIKKNKYKGFNIQNEPNCDLLQQLDYHKRFNENNKLIQNDYPITNNHKWDYILDNWNSTISPIVQNSLSNSILSIDNHIDMQYVHDNIDFNDYNDNDNDKWDELISRPISVNKTMLMFNSVLPTHNKTIIQSKNHDYCHKAYLSLHNKLYGLSFNNDDPLIIKNKWLFKLVNPKSLQPIEPKKIILTNHDRHMIILNALDDNKNAFLVDIETSKIIQEMKGDDEYPMKDISNMYKVKQENPYILAINKKNIFQLDPRVTKQDKCITMNKNSVIYDYNTLAVNDLQYFAIGSQNGDIHYFEKIGKNAMIIDHINEPIIGTDSSKDGKYLLITTKTNLIIANTYHNGLYAYNQREFHHSLRKIIFSIKPEDLTRRNIKNWAFTPAKFDYITEGNETSIITSISKLVIIWKFEDILNAKYHKYVIFDMDSMILANEFVFNKHQIFLSLQSKSLVIQKCVQRRRGRLK